MEAELDIACRKVGAVICKWPPDDMECEACGESQRQLYYIRTCYEVNDGEYYCAECIKAMLEKEAAEYAAWLERQGEQ